MRLILRTILVPVALAAIGFCSGCGDVGPQKLDADYMKSGEEVGKLRRDIFVRSSGNWDQMSSTDRAEYLASFDGNEENARRFWDLMKSPPTENRPGMPPTPGS
ncbi:MAG: hypothetical protein ACK4XJ_07405 [Fimbriimonadaceae bacterium]